MKPKPSEKCPFNKTGLWIIVLDIAVIIVVCVFIYKCMFN